MNTCNDLRWLSLIDVDILDSNKNIGLAHNCSSLHIENTFMFTSIYFVDKIDFTNTNISLRKSTRSSHPGVSNRQKSSIKSWRLSALSYQPFYKLAWYFPLPCYSLIHEHGLPCVYTRQYKFLILAYKAGLVQYKRFELLLSAIANVLLLTPILHKRESQRWDSNPRRRMFRLHILVQR